MTIPDRFDGRHPSTRHLLGLLTADHLPPHLAEISRPLCDQGHEMADRLGDGPELAVGLRHILDAKDALVRQRVIDTVGDR